MKVKLLIVNFSPKFELPVYDNKEQVKKAMITCHFCGETGHKAVSCFKVQQGQIPQTVQDGNKIEIQAQSQTNPPIQVRYLQQKLVAIILILYSRSRFFFKQNLVKL